MSTTRSDESRARDNALVERALLGRLVPPHDRTIHTKLVGVSKANPDGSSRQFIIQKMTQFETVELVRDPNDEWDRNAIEVHATVFEGVIDRGKGLVPSGLRRAQIGHLDRELCAELAPAIDAGEKWGAIVTRIGGPHTLGVGVMLYRLADAIPAAPADLDEGAPGVKPLHCMKCLHEWLPRRYRNPKVCPKCNNPGWNKGPKHVKKAATIAVAAGSTQAST